MREMTPFEEFVDRLRLDDRTQLPDVQKMLTDGARGASPFVTEMAQLRQQLINLEIGDKAADKPAVLAAYEAVAAKMTGAEAATFSQVFALLKPNQISRAPAAFEIMAGFFVPSVNLGRASRGPNGVVLGRLDILVTLFTLTGDQKKDIKTWFDETQKATDPARKGLAATRAVLATALQTGKGQDQIDAAVTAYAAHVTAMTDAEMAAFARLIKRLDPEQRSNQAGITTAFGLMRGMFAAKNWNSVPDGRAY
jgi:hypothetical protein